MSDNSTYDPYATFKNMSDNWEKQVNDVIHLWTNNTEFIRSAKENSDSHVRYLELFRKNQEMLATQLNLPTKMDLANVANLTIQTEEKIDQLEEQIWALSDSFNETSKKIESIVEVSRDVVKVTKQLKTELTRTKKQIADTEDLRNEIQEMKKELANFNDLKEEIASLKEILQPTLLPQENEDELQLVGESDYK